MVSNPGKNNIKNNTVNFYVDLVSFVIKKDKRSLLNKHGILVDQKNKLRTTNVLKLDEISHKQLNDDFDEKLKNIYASLTKKDCRNFLLHKNFEKIYDILEKEDKYYLKELAKDIDEELRNYEVNFQDEKFLLILKNLFSWYTTCGLSDETLKNLFPYFSQNKSQLYLNTKTAKELEYAFDIEISGKSEVLAKLANSSLSENELEIIAVNPKLVSNFIEWINSKQEDNPNEELGDIGEEFLHFKLCQIFGEDRVLWENKSEYDFRILETDLDNTKYYIDAKTTGKGIANAENVPFYMRTAQWHFLDREQAFDKYVIARVYKNGSGFDVKYVKINLMKMK
jgi:hypothetical protein